MSISDEQRIGSYRIVRKLGEGGMGAVYEAVHDQIGRRAAIKVLHPQYATNQQIASRFLNEARAANLIEHPGIVEVFEFGQTPDGAPFIVMELLKGEAMSARIRRLGDAAAGDALRFGRQIASALDEQATAFNTESGRAGQVQAVLQRQATQLQNRSDLLTKEIGDQRDADPAEVAVKISLLQTQYQASAKIFADLSKLSLLNYL